MRPSAIISLAVLLLGAGTVHAQECRAVQTVQHSADPAHNTADGGHLTQHIWGLNAPPNLNQATKTLWTSAVEFNTAWSKYVGLTNLQSPALCTGNAVVRQRVRVNALLGREVTGAWTCTAGVVGGACTTKTRTQYQCIQFDFINHNGSWILQTAYPNDC